MKLLKKALLYDISNIAWTVADCPGIETHALHQVRDICQEGNIDRVSRVLGLAYSQILSVLFPILKAPGINIDRDISKHPRDYVLIFRDDRCLKFFLTQELKLRIKETCHEYMVAMVLADWLAITLPEAAEVWKERALACFEALREIANSAMISSASSFRRKLSPF